MKFKLTDFSFGYKKLLFSHLNLVIPLNEIILLTGENGCGKTTFCRLLSGLEKDYFGKIDIAENDLNTLSIKQIADILVYHKQEPQGNIVAATPDEDLSIWQSKFTKNLNEQHNIQRKEVLTDLHIAEFQKTPFWELSSGQVKRSGIAALLLNPEKYWILDEPFNGLHQEIVDKLLAILKARRKSGFGTMIVTHNIEEIKEIADSILKIENETIRNLQ